MFCQDCQELICFQCGAIGHKGHDYALLEDALDTSHALVMAAAVRAVNEFGSVAEAEARCQQLRVELDQHARKGNNEIN
jgi:hypothetical protein